MKRIGFLTKSLAHAAARSMVKPGRPSRLATLPIVFMCMTACTFPDVQYDDEEEQTSIPFSPCTMPATCENPTDVCSKKADTERDACLKKCGLGIIAECSSCDAAHTADLNKCVAQCDTCSTTNGCATGLDSCKAALGIK